MIIVFFLLFFSDQIDFAYGSHLNRIWFLANSGKFDLLFTFSELGDHYIFKRNKRKKHVPQKML